MSSRTNLETLKNQTTARPRCDPQRQQRLFWVDTGGPVLGVCGRHTKPSPYGRGHTQTQRERGETVTETPDQDTLGGNTARPAVRLAYSKARPPRGLPSTPSAHGSPNRLGSETLVTKKQVKQAQVSGNSMTTHDSTALAGWGPHGGRW
jgi:hypothetical protein